MRMGEGPCEEGGIDTAQALDMVTAVDSPSRWESLLFGAGVRTPTVSTAFRWAHNHLVAPEFRLFRFALLIGLFISFVLAPFTSWSIDTPGFVIGVISLLSSGNPYSSHLFINPPLAPFLQAPLFAVLSVWISPQQLILTVPAIQPAATVTGVPVQIPSSVALLALKLPLIAAYAVSGFTVLFLAETWVGPKRANSAAIAWLLNPLVIWATAVHGEVDILAALAVLFCFAAILEHWHLLAGFSLGLGIMAKAYPLVLVPAILVVLLMWRRPSTPHVTFTRGVRFTLGLCMGILPFVPYFGTLFDLYSAIGNSTQYGGISFLSVFNRGELLPTTSVVAGLVLARDAVWVHGVLIALFGIALVGSGATLAAVLRRLPFQSPRSLARPLAFAFTWALTGALMFQTSPQSENLLTLLAMVAVLSYAERRLLRIVYWVLSMAGLFLYFSLLTPFAFFYPLANDIGLGWVIGLNSILIAYQTRAWLAPPDLWLATGLLGATAIAALWVLCFKCLVRRWDLD